MLTERTMRTMIAAALASAALGCRCPEQRCSCQVTVVAADKVDAAVQAAPEPLPLGQMWYAQPVYGVSYPEGAFRFTDGGLLEYLYNPSAKLNGKDNPR